MPEAIPFTSGSYLVIKEVTVISGIQRSLRLAAIGVLSLSAWAEQAKEASADIVCRFVSLGSDYQKPSVDEIAKRLEGIGKGISVKPVSPTSLFACSNASSINQVIAAIKEIAHIQDKPASDLPESHHVRLYFNRNAAVLAEAIAYTYPDLGVKALGPDLLVFKSKNPADGENIHELKRWIALMDSPRPEITLNAWSVQVSAPGDKGEESIRDISRGMRTIVATYNEQLKRSFHLGWLYLNSVRRGDNFPARRFGSYILPTYEANPETYQTVSNQPKRWCGDQNFCLGYGLTFTALMQPTLSNFIGVLAAANDPSHINNFVNCLEGRMSCALVKPQDASVGSFNRKEALPDKRVCEDQDETEYGESYKDLPAFYCFRRALTESLTSPARLALLRTAMADFLFQYKFSLQYPHEFEPFEYSASAQVLDAQLNPLLSAFNRDMTTYLRNLQMAILPDKNGHIGILSDSKNERGVKFLSNGIVTLRTISGTDSNVDSTTQNAFRETPPPLVQQFVKNLTDAEKNAPSLISENLAPHAAAALTAFLNSGQSPTISLGRDLKLQVTPTSLQGASSAELKVHLEAKDSDKPKRIKPDGTTEDDTTDRVANHTVETNIRVDSLGLFEISTLSAELSRGREPIPLLPPLVELPYIGSFLQYKPKPSTVQHRSFVILSAAILPTAADLLNGMRFEHDRWEGKSIMQASNDHQQEVAARLRKFHKDVLYCIAQEADQEDAGKDVTERKIKCADLPGPLSIAKK